MRASNKLIDLDQAVTNAACVDSFTTGENRMLNRLLLASLMIAAMSSIARARNTEYTLKIREVISSADFQDRVGNAVPFYFANQTAPPVAENLGEFVTNKKTNAFGKSDVDACRWAMLSALIQLRDRALQEGGNAVINVVSYYNREKIPDKNSYECRAGAVIAGVALKGTVVKLAK